MDEDEDDPKASEKAADEDRIKSDKVNPTIVTKSGEKYGGSFGMITNYKAPPVSTSTSISSQVLKKLKKNKPFEYLKMMISSRGSYGDKYSSASTTSGRVLTISSVEATLCAIKS